MSIDIACRNCGRVIYAREQFSGKYVTCPGCGKRVRISRSFERATQDESPIPVTCPECNASIRLFLRLLGRRVSCNTCGTIFTVSLTLQIVNESDNQNDSDCRAGNLAYRCSATLAAELPVSPPRMPLPEDSNYVAERCDTDPGSAEHGDVRHEDLVFGLPEVANAPLPADASLSSSEEVVAEASCPASGPSSDFRQTGPQTEAKPRTFLASSDRFRTQDDPNDETQNGKTGNLFAQGAEFFRTLKPIEWLKLYTILGGILGGVVSILLRLTGGAEHIPFVGSLLESSALSIASLVLVVLLTMIAFGYVAMNMPVRVTLCFLVAIFYVIGLGATTFRDSISVVINTLVLSVGAGTVAGSFVAFLTRKVAVRDFLPLDEDDDDGCLQA